MILRIKRATDSGTLMAVKGRKTLKYQLTAVMSYDILFDCKPHRKGYFNIPQKAGKAPMARLA